MTEHALVRSQDSNTFFCRCGKRYSSSRKVARDMHRFHLQRVAGRSSGRGEAR